MRWRGLASAVAFAAGSAAAAAANSWNLEAGLTGVPREGDLGAEATCTTCHATAALNPDGEASIEVRGLPERYLPGVRYTLTFAIEHPGADRLRWGFQLTAVAAQTLRGAGRFVLTDPENTRRLSGSADRQYMVHTYPGTAIGRAGGQTWSFDWTAPLRDVGAIAFFGVAVAADADGSERGDFVYGPAPAALRVLPAPFARPALEGDADPTPEPNAPPARAPAEPIQ